MYVSPQIMWKEMLVLVFWNKNNDSEPELVIAHVQSDILETAQESQPFVYTWT